MHRTSGGCALLLAIVAGVLGAGPARAATWESFEAAFPLFPCQDGWMACQVSAARVDPGLQWDGSGLPVSADQRIGWFDLAPTPTFSPFQALARYVVTAPPPAPPVPPAPPAPPDPTPGRGGNTKTSKGSKGSTGPGNPGSPPGGSPGGSSGGTGETEPTEPKAKPNVGGGGPVEPDEDRPGQADATPVQTGDCSNTVALEPLALLGKLSEGTQACLEARLAGAQKLTDKARVSGLLMADAWARGDKGRWEVLIRRHLDEIDQSDPDLCYKYALHLSRQGTSRAQGVLRWADVALENRSVWTGETYSSRVYSLYKIRAAASQSLWQSAENAHAKTPSDKTRAQAEEYRSLTKVVAREWLEYARMSGKDPATALELCKAAAGTADYCME